MSNSNIPDHHRRSQHQYRQSQNQTNQNHLSNQRSTNQSNWIAINTRLQDIDRQNLQTNRRAFSNLETAVSGTTERVSSHPHLVLSLKKTEELRVTGTNLSRPTEHRPIYPEETETTSTFESTVPLWDDTTKNSLSKSELARIRYRIPQKVAQQIKILEGKNINMGCKGSKVKGGDDIPYGFDAPYVKVKTIKKKPFDHFHNDQEHIGQSNTKRDGSNVRMEEIQLQNKPNKKKPRSQNQNENKNRTKKVSSQGKQSGEQHPSNTDTEMARENEKHSDKHILKGKKKTHSPEKGSEQLTESGNKQKQTTGIKRKQDSISSTTTMPEVEFCTKFRKSQGVTSFKDDKDLTDDRLGTRQQDHRSSDIKQQHMKHNSSSNKELGNRHHIEPEHPHFDPNIKKEAKKNPQHMESHHTDTDKQVGETASNKQQQKLHGSQIDSNTAITSNIHQQQRSPNSNEEKKDSEILPPVSGSETNKDPNIYQRKEKDLNEREQQTEKTLFDNNQMQDRNKSSENIRQDLCRRPLHTDGSKEETCEQQGISSEEHKETNVYDNSSRFLKEQLKSKYDDANNANIQPGDEQKEQDFKKTRKQREQVEVTTDTDSNNLDSDLTYAEKSKQLPTENLKTTQQNANLNQDYSGTAIQQQEDQPGGIPNIGATCYANSVFQVLGQTPGLMELLHKCEPEKDSEEMRAMHSLKDLLEDLVTKPFVDTGRVHMLMNYLIKNDESFSLGYQNDCHSFLLCLFNTLKDEMPEGSLELFEGKQCNVFTYDTCDDEEKSDEQMFNSLLIPVKPNKKGDWSIEKGLDTLAMEETFEDNIIPCRACEEEKEMGEPEEEKTEIDFSKTLTTKRTVFTELPHILVLHIGRFKEVPVQRGSQFKKLVKMKCNVQYEEILTVHKFANKRLQDMKYRLYGVISHSGSIHGGHYSASVRKLGTDKWFFCSDSSVGSMVSKTCQDKDAYVLFYEQIQPDNKQEMHREETESL